MSKQVIVISSELFASAQKELRAAHAVISRAESLLKNCVIGVSEISDEVRYAIKMESAERRFLVKRTEEGVPGIPDEAVGGEGSVRRGEESDCGGETKAVEGRPSETQKPIGFVQPEFALGQGGSSDPEDGHSTECDGRNERETAVDTAKKDEKPSVKRGFPTIGRKQALKNFREIVGTREIIDLQDVNLVFGYHKSTSGTFIRCAIRRGELAQIQYGSKMKFLAHDLKNFIKTWYDEAEKNG